MKQPAVFDEVAFDARNQSKDGHRNASGSSALIRQTRESVLQSNPNRMPITSAQTQSTSKPPPNKKPTLSVPQRQQSVIVVVEPNNGQTTDEPKRKRRLSQSTTASSSSSDRNGNNKRSESIANRHTETTRSFEQPPQPKKKSPTIPSELHNTIQSTPTPSSSGNHVSSANPRPKQSTATYSIAALNHSLGPNSTVSFENSAPRATAQIQKPPAQKQKTLTFTGDRSSAQFDPVADSHEPNINQLMAKNPRSTSYSWSHKRPGQNTQEAERAGSDEFGNPMNTFEDFKNPKPANESAPALPQHTSLESNENPRKRNSSDGHTVTNDNADEKKSKDSALKEESKIASASSSNDVFSMFGADQTYSNEYRTESNFGDEFNFDVAAGDIPSNINDSFNAFDSGASFSAELNPNGSEFNFTEPNLAFDFNGDENGAIGTTDVRNKLLFMKIMCDQSIHSRSWFMFFFFFFRRYTVHSHLKTFSNNSNIYLKFCKLCVFFCRVHLK